MAVTHRRNTNPTRRAMLQAGLACAVSPLASKTCHAADSCARSDRTLVLLHLSGGNDGLNTLIPYTDPLYYRLRPRLSRVARDVIPINGKVGFHPSLSSLAGLFRRRVLAIVQGVGYPDADYSHIGSCRVWATGTKDVACRRPWWEEVLGGLRGAEAVFVHDGTEATIATPPMDASAGMSYLPEGPERYRPGQVRRTLATIARLVGSKRPPVLVLAAVGGFDTHADQLDSHDAILRELGDALAAFQRELELRAVAKRVVLMAWSEFGRRPAENTDGGTDHGSAGPVLVLGSRIRGGLWGEAPSLEATDFGNLVHTVDFRTIHALMANRWLGCPSTGTLKQPADMPFV